MLTRITLAAWPRQEQLEELATAHRAQVMHELRGNYFDVAGAHGNFLWPQIVTEEVAASAKNDDSLIFPRGIRRTLSTARRCGKNVRARYSLESTSDELRSDVLTIAHHGSRLRPLRISWPRSSHVLRLFPPANKTLTGIRTRNLSNG